MTFTFVLFAHPNKYNSTWFQASGPSTHQPVGSDLSQVQGRVPTVDTTYRSGIHSFGPQENTYRSWYISFDWIALVSNVKVCILLLNATFPAQLNCVFGVLASSRCDQKSAIAHNPWLQVLYSFVGFQGTYTSFKSDFFSLISSSFQCARPELVRSKIGDNAC